MAGPTEVVHCPLCGAEGQPFRRKHGLDIVRCASDRLLWVSPRPVDMRPFYDASYYGGSGLPGLYESYEAMVVNNRSQWGARLDHIEASVGTGRMMLDVGSATGDMLALAAERGWDVQGIELSEWAAAEANSRGIPTMCGSLPDPALADESFDAVTLWDCIEHLADPLSVLEDVSRVLRPGGMVVVTTGLVPDDDPDRGRHWYFPPWHLWYFSQRTLADVVTRAGLRPGETTVTGNPEAEIITLTAHVGTYSK